MLYNGAIRRQSGFRSSFILQSRLCLALFISLLPGPKLLGQTVFTAGLGEEVVPDQLIVRLQPGASVIQVLSGLGAQAVPNLISGSLNTYLFKLPAGSQVAASRLLGLSSAVRYVEPNRIRRPNVVPPNDPSLPQQWDLATLQAVKAWSLIPDKFLTAASAGNGSARVKVALIDTGVDCTHPDFMNAGGTSTDSALGGQLSWSLSKAIQPTTIPAPACPWQDFYGHGTHTAGTIAAATNNGAGVASVGYPLELIVYQVFQVVGGQLEATDADIATAIDDAVADGASVISMSLGGQGYSQSMQTAMDFAWSHNVLVVAATGNNGSNVLVYPGQGNHVLGVAATHSNNSWASFSNYGNGVKIAGPGVLILSTLPTYGNGLGSINYGVESGTSMATPHVAAVAGLLYMLYPNLSVADIAQRLQRTALTPNTGWDQGIGYGVVSAWGALSGTLSSATHGSLTGQVVDTFGNPINGAQVSAGGLSFTTAVDPSSGDINGLFRLANLNPGTYTVSVTAGGFSAVNMQAVVVAGADTMLTASMGVSTGEFTGAVTSSGAAIAGAAVVAISGGAVQATAVTDSFGTYALYVKPGSYTVTASAANFNNAASSLTSVGAGGTSTVNLSLSPSGNITGTVTDGNGVAVANAHIDFTTAGFSGGAATDVNGAYSTSGLPSGIYTVTASASGYANVTASGVSVAASGSTLVNLHFATGIALNSGLLGYWPFNENAGSVAHDASGSGHDAALTNTAWTSGIFSSALSFNGSNSLGLTPAISFTNTFSISSWVNPAVTTQAGYARIAETLFSSEWYLGADVSGAHYQFIVNAGAGSTGTCGVQYGCAVGGAVSTGWHLVTGTYDGTTAILYVDAAMVASDTFTAPANAGFPVYIGQSAAHIAVWNGSLDDMRLYGRALTASEVASIFALSTMPALTLSKTADAITVSAGSAIGYTLSAGNSGGVAATSAALSDALPSGTGVSWSISPVYIGPGTCSIVNQVLNCAIGSLAAGANATVHVMSSTTGSSCAPYTNTASLSAGNSATVQASATTTVQCPTLALTKTADAAAVSAGSSIGYTLTVSNSGAGAATSATLSDTLPAGTGISWSISPAYGGPGMCSIAGQVLSCNFGDLASSAAASVHVTSSTTASSCAAYENTASLSAANAATVPASATTTVQCPTLALSKTADAATVSAGTSIGYTLTAKNTGAGTATSAALSDMLPSGTGVSWSISPVYSGLGTCSIANQVLSCNFGNLASNTTATVHVMSNTSSSSCAAYANTGSLSAANAATVQASATTTVQCPTLALTKTADAAAVSAGSSIGYTLTVSNSGAGVAAAVALSDTLPSGTGIAWSINPAYNGAGACSIANQVLACNFGNLASNTTVTVHVTSGTSASSCAAYANTASVSAGNNATVQASATTTVQCPTLALTKTADAATVSAGSSIGYTLTVKNTGAGTATSATLSDTLPSGNGVSWGISPAYNGPGTCSITNLVLNCAFGDLAAGANTSLHLTSGTSASSCAAYPNTATLSAGNSAQVQASATTTVQCPTLGLTKTADATTVPAGSAMGYTLTVTNSGSGTATSATLSDALPSGTGVSWSISPAYSGPGTCSIGNQVLNCAFGSLGPGAATVHVTSGTSAASCAVYANTATLSAGNASSVQASATTTVRCPALSITKTHAGSFSQGQPGVTYTATVSNSGAAPTIGAVTVTETMPIGLTLVSMAGNGWSCQAATFTCTRSDALNPGAGYSSIVITVNVDPSTPSAVTNQVTVSGGGAPNATARDGTAIAPFSCDLNGDGALDVGDVQIMINEMLGVIPAMHDLTHDGLVTVVDLQKQINAVLGMGCPY